MLVIVDCISYINFKLKLIFALNVYLQLTNKWGHHLGENQVVSV